MIGQHRTPEDVEAEMVRIGYCPDTPISESSIIEAKVRDCNEYIDSPYIHFEETYSQQEIS